MSDAKILESLPMPMGYFRLILRWFGDSPQRRTAILAGTGVTEESLADSSADISALQQMRQFDNVTELFGEGWALTSPELWHHANRGALGVAALTAKSLGSSLEILARYSRTRASYNRVVFSRFRSEGRLDYDPLVALEEPQLRAAAEIRFMFLRSLVAAILGRPPTEARYQFECSEPAHADKVRAVLGGTVTYGADHCSFAMPADQFDEPSPYSDPTLHARAVEELDRALLRLSRPLEMRGQVDRLLHTMPGTRLDAATAARALGISRRTLTRRLAEAGVGFRELLDGELRLRARRLLDSGGLSHAEIADRLGYADATSLSRACRRWFGAAVVVEEV
jgi:AraC-like DNA-binding protein